MKLMLYSSFDEGMMMASPWSVLTTMRPLGSRHSALTLFDGSPLAWLMGVSCRDERLYLYMPPPSVATHAVLLPVKSAPVT